MALFCGLPGTGEWPWLVRALNQAPPPPSSETVPGENGESCGADFCVSLDAHFREHQPSAQRCACTRPCSIKPGRHAGHRGVNPGLCSLRPAGAFALPGKTGSMLSGLLVGSVAQASTKSFPCFIPSSAPPRGPLNWYRNMERNWQWGCKGLGRKVSSALFSSPTSHPSGIHGPNG